MKRQREKCSVEENFFISAIHQEVFNRVFPCIRHDLVGGVSASLMRVSIMERRLNKVEITSELLKEDLKKIELQLKENIISIRALQFWDFDSVHEDIPIDILKKSVHLMASRLALRFIQTSVQTNEDNTVQPVKTKPLLLSLLCAFSYIEDNHFDNHQLNVGQSGESIYIQYEPKTAQDSTIKINRNLIFDQGLVTRFANHYEIDVNFSQSEITLGWN
ncbi:MAG: hypothetical protein CTY33_05745 [Methylotenera sp.]|nr:MAG: hypothetical protein CTY33_05745 [Methylotenera sp.]